MDKSIDFRARLDYKGGKAGNYTAGKIEDTIMTKVDAIGTKKTTSKRDVTVVFKSGIFIETKLNGTDEQINEYYKVGSRFNVGRGQYDRIDEVATVYIYN